jgi:hypothetical protein
MDSPRSAIPRPALAIAPRARRGQRPNQSGRYSAVAPCGGVRNSHGDDLPRLGLEFFPAQDFELLA